MDDCESIILHELYGHPLWVLHIRGPNTRAEVLWRALKPNPRIRETFIEFVYILNSKGKVGEPEVTLALRAAFVSGRHIVFKQFKPRYKTIEHNDVSICI